MIQLKEEITGRSSKSHFTVINVGNNTNEYFDLELDDV